MLSITCQKSLLHAKVKDWGTLSFTGLCLVTLNHMHDPLNAMLGSVLFPTAQTLFQVMVYVLDQEMGYCVSHCLSPS